MKDGNKKNLKKRIETIIQGEEKDKAIITPTPTPQLIN